VKSAAAAAGLAVALLAAAARSGESAPPAKPAAELHWGLPRQVGPMLTASPQTGLLAPLPVELVAAGERLVALVDQPPNRWGGGGGSAQVFVRDAQGPWGELAGLPGGSAASPLVPAGKELALLTSTMNDRARFGGTAEGRLQLAAIAMEPGGKVRSADVYAPKPAGSAMMGGPTSRALGAALAARGQVMLAAFWLQKNDLAGSSTELWLRGSADAGATWSELPAVAKCRDQAAADVSLTLWADRDKFHLLYCPPPAKPGEQPPPLKHVTSADGSAWKDGSALLAAGAKEGQPKSFYSARALQRGQDLYLLALDAAANANGGKVWLVTSPDAGASWKPPVKVADRRGYGPLAGYCQLAAGEGLLLYGAGWREDNGKAGGELLASRDGGASWQKLDFAAGLVGQASAPRAVSGPDGAIHVFFGWTDGASAETALLCRTAAPQPEPGPSEKDRAAMAELVKDLAADDWRVREKSAAGLIRYGPAALPALRAAAKDPDPERSLAAEGLIRKVKPPWLKD